VGAFHYSQGLETAVHRGWVADAASAQNWITAGLQRGLTHVDLPLLARAWRAWGQRDEAALLRWNAHLRACRETAALRDEDASMGTALAKLAETWGEPRPEARLGYVCMFAVLAANSGIDERETLAGFAWAWCENMSLVATKSIPLGHLSGQRMLRDLSGEVDAAVTTSLALADEDIGAGMPGAMLASAQHAQLHARVFRS